MHNRFWSKVDWSAGPDECWEWRGAVARGTGHLAYGRFRLPKGHVYAHRYAWEATNGSIPDGKLILHNCDNPRCCNPAHLRLGTHRDNANDKIVRGRAASGDRNGARQRPDRLARGQACHTSKLSPDQVREIRRRYAAGNISFPKLAREYGVAHSNIAMIVHRKAWRHIE